jgi:hypothetical protein
MWSNPGWAKIGIDVWVPRIVLGSLTILKFVEDVDVD